jgi:hypothetical protein
MSNNIKTFQLYGAAYMTDKALANLKTHACEVDERGFPVRILCKRAKLENVFEDPTQATDETPTCPVCAKRMLKARSA